MLIVPKLPYKRGVMSSDLKGEEARKDFKHFASIYLNDFFHIVAHYKCMLYMYVHTKMQLCY